MSAVQLSLQLDHPLPAAPPTAERMASDVVTDQPAAGSGMALYTIEEWHAKFGKPPIAYGQIENDA